MSDKEIIDLLLERANRIYPVALAVHPVVVRELCVKDPYKYRELIDKMVDQELVKNTFGDFIRILPRGKSIVDSGGYIKFIMLQPKRHERDQIVRRKHIKRNPPTSSGKYFSRNELQPFIRSLAAVIFSFFTFHR